MLSKYSQSVMINRIVCNSNSQEKMFYITTASKNVFAGNLTGDWMYQSQG